MLRRGDPQPAAGRPVPCTGAAIDLRAAAGGTPGEHPRCPSSTSSPISAGSTVAEALRNTVDLARAAERAATAGYWLAEHHLNPGVAGASPPW